MICNHCGRDVHPSIGVLSSCFIFLWMLTGLIGMITGFIAIPSHNRY